MLTKEKNDLLCRVGPGTAGNRLFRTIWLPALPSAQLPATDPVPTRLRLLGEDLIAFRDGAGRPAIVQSRCVHRGAPLFFGKIETQGLRCPYHGWVFDVQGQCVEIPSIPDPRVARNMQIQAYPVVEKAGVIWVYMGDGATPELPNFPWIDLPASQRSATVWLQETNWVQGMEGEIDTAHIAILHKTKKRATRAHRSYTFTDLAPQLSTQDTKIGLLSIARRNAAEQFYWRVTQWMAPMFSFVPSADWPIGGRAWVPIDDENTYTWNFAYSSQGDLPPEYLAVEEAGLSFPPQREYRSVELNTGSIIDTWLPLRQKSNDYLVNRALQREFETTGILGINDQDRAIQDYMGRVADRSVEKLVATDRVIVQARAKLLAMLESEASLEAFREVIQDGTAYAMEPVDMVSPTGDVRTFLSENGLI